MRTRSRTWLLTAAAMLAFAANSLLCRQALAHTQIDPATFTTIRIAAGAVLLGLLNRRGRLDVGRAGSWTSAAALFAYAAAFSFAYRTLPASTGALLLFGAVQVTMIGRGMARGERLVGPAHAGMILALGGLTFLLMMQGVTTPSLRGALLMLGAGVAWGVYSLRGSGGQDPARATAGNFVRAVPFAVLLSVVTLDTARLDLLGCLYAAASGALASGLGYTIWYAALRGLTRISAATVQLSVPVLTGLLAVLLLGEPLTGLCGASAAVLGGIALINFTPQVTLLRLLGGLLLVLLGGLRRAPQPPQ
ncbi:MAG: EamA family transporter [Planctomycetota bacterium]